MAAAYLWLWWEKLKIVLHSRLLIKKWSSLFHSSSYHFFCHHLPFEGQHITLYFNLGMCSEATITTRPAHGKKFAIGTILSLRCRCPSSSPGTTRWIKNGVTVSATSGRITVDQRKLNINSTSFADSGNYTCYVTVAELGTAKSETVEIWGKKAYMLSTCI